VVVGFPEAEGLYGDEAPRIYGLMVSQQTGLFGAFGGLGGFGLGGLGFPGLGGGLGGFFGYPGFGGFGTGLGLWR
jgi:hypothetical protein